MEFKFDIGDIVRIKPGNMLKKLVGAVGVIMEREKRPYYPNETYAVELPKSVVDNLLVLKNGIAINGINVRADDLRLALETDEEEEKLLSTLMNQEVNEKRNTWEVRIRPSDDDKNFTCAELYINGRYEREEYVKRYHEDEYNAGIACIEVCKKLFNVKGEPVENALAPKYYTGKVVCIKNHLLFVKGKIYEVEDGNIIDEEGTVYNFIEGVNDLCARTKAEFIEVIE